MVDEIKDKKKNEEEMQKEHFTGGSLKQLQAAINDLYDKVNDIYERLKS